MSRVRLVRVAMVLALSLLALISTQMPLSKAQSQSQCLSLLVVGDQGGTGIAPTYTSPQQLRVAASMAALAPFLNTSLVVGLGDNFYELGVTGLTDSRFQVTFENVYLSYPSLAPPKVQWRVIAGNHDWYGQVEAQLAYSKWQFPSLSHALTLTLPGGATAQLIFLDSFHLTSEAHRSVPVNATHAALTLQWLKDTLAQSSPTWTLFFTHYPYMSASTHGYNAQVESALKPILRSYRPVFYMAGHDHNLQHVVESDLGVSVHHYVVGSGARLDPTMDPSRLPSNARLEFHWPKPLGALEGGFGSVVICPTSVTVRLYNELGVQKHVHVHALGDERAVSPQSSAPPVPVNAAPLSSDSLSDDPFVLWLVVLVILLIVFVLLALFLIVMRSRQRKDAAVADGAGYRRYTETFPGDAKATTLKTKSNMEIL